MRLFHFDYSTYSRKVRKCLELKGLACELVLVPYLDRRVIADLANGYVMVPVLEDGGRVITDSPAITAYLDARYAPSLRPGALEGPAVIYEQWADTLFEDVAFRIATPGAMDRLVAANGGRSDVAGMYRFSKERKFGPGCIEAWRDGERELVDKLRALSMPLAGSLERQRFLLGPQATLADAAVWGPLSSIEDLRPGWIRANLPALAAWYERVASAGVESVTPS
jgi:glutathione S-transferase